MSYTVIAHSFCADALAVRYFSDNGNLDQIGCGADTRCHDGAV